MTRRLWLHIGSHKTGTSSLQVTLRANEALLLGRGLGVARSAPWPHVHPFLVHVTPRQIMPDGFQTADPADFARFLADTAGDNVIASSENFAYFFRQSAVDDLAAALKPQFDEVRILTYLRRQDRHAVSHHQEGAKHDRAAESALWGHGLNALPDPSPLHRLYLDYDQRIGMWERAFGSDSVVVRVFDRTLLKDGDIVADVLNLVGISDEGLTRLPDRNVSLGRLQAKVGHIANATLNDDILTRSLVDAMPVEDRMTPARNEARAFLEPYREANRRLNDRLNISAEPALFSDDFSDYPEVGNDHLDEAACIMAVQETIVTLGRRAKTLQSLSADDLKVAALALQELNPEVALRLIQAARSLRPNGPHILKILGRLEARAKEPETE